MSERHFELNQNMLDKCMEISEILKIRFGMMLVGPAMSCKSTLLNLIDNASNRLRKKFTEDPESQDS